MKITIEPGNISGTTNAPPSKSMTQRVYAGALLHKGRTIIHNAGRSNDEEAALGVIQALGAQVHRDADTVTVVSSGISAADEINCGESGLCARLFIPIAALSNKQITVTGTGSLLKRQLMLPVDVMAQLGVQMQTTNGCLPATLQGALVPTDITIDGSQSSQFLSGLLFAFCNTESNVAHTISVNDLKSRPYVDMTMHVLKLFGCDVRQDEYKVFYTESVQESFRDEDVAITIESDWSSAAYLLVAGAIAGSVKVNGLVNSRLQADNAIVSVLEQVGADVSWENGVLSVKKGKLNAFEFDATERPDLFPVLAVLAACCDGESYIKGVHRLFHKESNRAESISELLMNFDVPYSIEDDTLCITGVRRLQGTVIDPYGDHRIAMAAAVGGLRAGSRVDILDAEVVRKSYPDFFEDLISIGGKCIFNDD